MTTKTKNCAKWAKFEQTFKVNDTHIRAMELYWCGFQAPSCVMQTRINGNVVTSKLYNYTIIMYLQYHLLQ